MGRDPNKGRRGDPKLNCVLSTSPACLCLSVAYRYLRTEYIFDFEIELGNLLPKVTNAISIFLGRGVSTTFSDG